MRNHPFTSRFDGPAAALISRATLYIRATFISSNAYSSHNSSGCVIKRRCILKHLQDVVL